MPLCVALLLFDAVPGVWRSPLLDECGAQRITISAPRLAVRWWQWEAIMRHAVFFFILVANVTVAQQPLFRTVDLDVGTTERVQVANGRSAIVKVSPKTSAMTSA